MAYEVSFKSSAEKALLKLPKPIRNRVMEKVTSLANEPRPQGAVKLAGPSGFWRIRAGIRRPLCRLAMRAWL
jgi:mRNA interferase RelE/StbE